MAVWKNRHGGGHVGFLAQSSRESFCLGTVKAQASHLQESLQEYFMKIASPYNPRASIFWGMGEGKREGTRSKEETKSSFCNMKNCCPRGWQYAQQTLTTCNQELLLQRNICRVTSCKKILPVLATLRLSRGLRRVAHFIQI